MGNVHEWTLASHEWMHWCHEWKTAGSQPDATFRKGKIRKFGMGIPKMGAADFAGCRLGDEKRRCHLGWHRGWHQLLRAFLRKYLRNGQLDCRAFMFSSNFSVPRSRFCKVARRSLVMVESPNRAPMGPAPSSR